MKNPINPVAIIVILTLVLANAIYAQTTVIWKGGAPGQENNWNCPKNWSNYKVPNDFSDVVIPDVSSTTLSAPVIKNGVFEVNSIQVHPNAELTIEQDAQLMVHTIHSDFLNKLGLRIKGSLLIVAEDGSGKTFAGLQDVKKH